MVDVGFCEDSEEGLSKWGMHFLPDAFSFIQSSFYDIRSFIFFPALPSSSTAKCARVEKRKFDQ